MLCDVLSTIIILVICINFRQQNGNNFFSKLFYFLGDESPTFNSVSVGTLNMNTFSSLQEGELPNQVSAPFEVPHFPIEQIENKLLMQRQLNSK